MTPIYDATGYLGGIPGALALGIKPFSWVSSASISMPPQQSQVNAAADSAMAASGFLGIDLEGAGTDLNYDDSDQATVQARGANYAQILAWAHARQPALKTGLWANFPVGVNGFEHIGQLDVPGWQAHDNFVATYISTADFVAMQLYHAFDGSAGWLDFATNAIAEMRRVANGRPVYAILFPFWNISANNPSLNPPLDPAIWQLMLTTCLANCDGVILWAGYGVGQGEPPNGSAWNNPWWWPQVAALFVPPLLSFTQSLYQKFKTDPTLGPLFPAYNNNFGQQVPVAYYRDQAPEDAPMPYCTSTLIPTGTSTVYGLNGPIEYQVQFTVTARGHDAALMLAGRMVEVLDDPNFSMTLVTGSISSVRRLTEIIPLLDGPDGTGADVWDCSVTYSFSAQ